MRKQGASTTRKAILAVANKEIQMELLKLLGNDLMDIKFEDGKVLFSTRKELDKDTARDCRGLLKAQVVVFDESKKPEVVNGWYQYTAKNNGSPLLARLTVKANCGITVLKTKPI